MRLKEILALRLFHLYFLFSHLTKGWVHAGIISFKYLMSLNQLLYYLMSLLHKVLEFNVICYIYMIKHTESLIFAVLSTLNGVKTISFNNQIVH